MTKVNKKHEKFMWAACGAGGSPRGDHHVFCSSGPWSLWPATVTLGMTRDMVRTPVWPGGSSGARSMFLGWSFPVVVCLLAPIRIGMVA